MGPVKSTIPEAGIHMTKYPLPTTKRESHYNSYHQHAQTKAYGKQYVFACNMGPLPNTNSSQRLHIFGIVRLSSIANVNTVLIQGSKFVPKLVAF
jgi:hypothetical protein